MATTTNFGWSTPDNTGYVKDGALSIRTLGTAIDASMAPLRGGTTGQVLKKASGSNMDFVWGTVSSTPRIAQVVTATSSASTTATGGAGWVDVTGLTVTITPTLTTSKILILVSGSLIGQGTQYQAGFFGLYKGATALYTPFLGTNYVSTTGTNLSNNMPYAIHYIDSPATTSATTYKMQINNIYSTTVWGANNNAVITAMEILV